MITIVIFVIIVVIIIIKVVIVVITIISIVTIVRIEKALVRLMLPLAAVVRICSPLPSLQLAFLSVAFSALLSVCFARAQRMDFYCVAPLPLPLPLRRASLCFFSPDNLAKSPSNVSAWS